MRVVVFLVRCFCELCFLVIYSFLLELWASPRSDHDYKELLCLVESRYCWTAVYATKCWRGVHRETRRAREHALMGGPRVTFAPASVCRTIALAIVDILNLNILMHYMVS